MTGPVYSSVKPTVVVGSNAASRLAGLLSLVSTLVACCASED